MDSYQSLNQSKFLSEQINNQQQPTEQQILEKADQLQIDDLALAKQSLTKELDQQWKPYINRNGDIYYINLQQRKAYVDHPVDMEIKITYALKYKKRVPVFKQYSLEQISKSPKLVQEQINSYQRNKALNIVYEQSQEDSMRRDTLQSVEQPVEIVQLDNTQLDSFRFEMQRKLKLQIEQYRRSKEIEHNNRVRISKQRIEDVKKAHLNNIIHSIEQETDLKNKATFDKNIQNTKEDLLKKRHKFEDLHCRQINLLQIIKNTHEDKQQEIKQFFRKKLLHSKQKMVSTLLQQQKNDLKIKMAHEISQQSNLFADKCQHIINTKINLKERLFFNIEKLQNQANYASKQTKKRFSIFNSQVFSLQKESQKETIQSITQKLKINQLPYQKPFVLANNLPVYVPSLTLRLSKRIL